MSEIDKSIERIKSTVTTLCELLAEIDEQRENDKKEFEKRLSRLEHAYIRHAFSDRTDV